MGKVGTHWGEGPLPLLEVELVEAQSMKDVNLGGLRLFRGGGNSHVFLDSPR